MKLDNTVDRWIKIWLRVFGIWPDTSCVLLRRLFWAVTLIIWPIFQYRFIVMNFYSADFSELVNTLSTIIAHLLLLIKISNFWYRQRTFDNVLTMIAIDWKKCSSKEFGMCMATCKQARRFANFTMVLYSIAVTSYSSNIFARRTGNDEISDTLARPLILNMELPFDSNKTFVYELVIIIQFLHLLSMSYMIGLLNALLINLILHVGNQIDILREWLMNVFSKKTEHHLSPTLLKRIIRKHQKIIIFSEHIENLFSNIAMVLFVSDTIIICCLGFILVTSIGSPDATKIIMSTLLFYFVINMEAFIFCFAGEYLSVKSRTVGDAAYDSLWYESDSKSSRTILLLIMRSQNQLTITIGKVMNLSLERFSSIMKASASYISVLHAMMN